MSKYKGIILAGGSGSRLNPATLVISKQLLPVYDKPMIYYPLSVLMLEKPEGLAQAFLIGEEFLAGSPACLILGDNIYYGSGMTEMLKTAQIGTGATVFAYQVSDPERYGVVEFDSSNVAISLEEKPLHPKSDFAVTGLYFYDADVVKYAKQIRPSSRGELEITDLNKLYLQAGKLQVITMKRGFAWLDTGTHDSLLEASNFIQTIEHRQGIKIACLEEIALHKKLISIEQVRALVEKMGKSTYAEYLRRIVRL